MKARHKRIIFVVFAVMAVGVAAYLVNTALRQNISYFYSPSEVLAGKVPQDHVFRLGGMVKKGSVKRGNDNLEIEFIVTDYAKDMVVRYTGILPDLFKEDKGVVTKGRLEKGGMVFLADEVLAKHDENYMPPEVAASLKPNVGQSVPASTSKGSPL